MKIQQFLDHHGISRNPFAEEDAQTDVVFMDHCIDGAYHPTWDKVYGDPSVPSTSVVFGEKGAGKTAMRLQIAKNLETYNKTAGEKKVFVLHYDDFNPFLDRFRNHWNRSGLRADKLLAQWRLWDHMDAILSVAMTGLIDRILGEKQRSAHVEAEVDATSLKKLSRHEARDLLLLAACYDQSSARTYLGRWHAIRSKLGFRTWKTYVPLVGAIVWSVGYIALIGSFLYRGWLSTLTPFWLHTMLLLLGWAPFVWRIAKRFWLSWKVCHWNRVTNHEVAPLTQILLNFTDSELTSQPLPCRSGTDDRYELLMKLQTILGDMGFSGIIALVDRADEPHLINGSAELMKGLIWPLLDNKFLKHPGLGLKMMLPIELKRFIEREDRDFYQRARLDKQNMIPVFEWTGEALYDVTNARILACAKPGATPNLRSLVQSTVSDRRLFDAFRSLRVPRRLFKFFYRLFVVHCNAYSDDNPVWQISSETFESTLALCLHDADAFDRGMGAG